MRIARFLLILLILFKLPTFAVFAQDDEPITGLVSVDQADVRIGPDFAYDAIGQLPRNTAVVVLGRAGDFFYSWDGMEWLQIQYGDRAAWVYARLLRTSVRFNDIPPTGHILPRDRDGRVPKDFNLSSEVCDQWQGAFSRAGDFMAGDQSITVSYPALTGTVYYAIIVLSPTGFRTEFDSKDTSATLDLAKLPGEVGTYTWRVAPFWDSPNSYYSRQQICLLRTGGTFDKPKT
jgi:hypothetical protein